MNSEISAVIEGYPPEAKARLKEMRKMVMQVAKELELADVEETLKWGEPSYISTVGSTIRMDWKAKRPDRCSFYFSCQSKLVSTFRELYGDQLQFEGNREMVLPLNEPLPEAAIKHCLHLALQYQKVKHLPLLGA